MASLEQQNLGVFKDSAKRLLRHELEAAGYRREHSDGRGPKMELVIQVAESCDLKPGDIARLSGLSRQGVLNARNDRRPARLEGAGRSDCQAFFLAVLAANGGVQALGSLTSIHLHLTPAETEDFRARLALADLRKRGLIAISKAGGREAITLLSPALVALEDRRREAIWATRSGHNFFIELKRDQAPSINDAAYALIGSDDFAVIYPEETLNAPGAPELAFRVSGQMSQREARQRAEELWTDIREEASLAPSPAFVSWYYPSGEAVIAS